MDRESTDDALDPRRNFLFSFLLAIPGSEQVNEEDKRFSIVVSAQLCCKVAPILWEDHCANKY